MAPRKVSDAPATEPRRSGRIASQPVVAAPEKPAKKPKATKKRSAEALDEPKDESATKKAKADPDNAAAAPTETEAPKEEAPAPPATEDAKEDAKDSEEAQAAPAVAETEAEGSKDAPVPIKQLEIGDNLPALTLQNEEGGEIKVAELAAEKGVVLFLVPKAATPGCTNQACGFRDIYPDFTSLNYDVYCLSADSPTAQNKWKTNANPKRTLITALGAGQDGKTKRSHFIFEKGGKLVEKKLPVSPKDSPKLALEFIKARSE
ncbi:Peroxiredoxin bcp1 [Psilocybe cubensis]|uniref:Peroxiredoxin bcp1 n=2 Tax=Psilocybe cubensis TaxID=181762 RepID=A0ACB8GKB7_PSICU|nr:Peroxiredoxin bcp1 [Psilocybe cubensis]KAH9476121.1 Peroxiredoxin bcp1 [Psilocybe cubensis]